MKVIFLRILIAYLATTSITGAQTHLAYNLKVGDEFTVTQVAKQDIVQNMNGKKHEMTNLLEGDFTFVVESVSDSIYGIKFKFDRFKMISNSNLIGEIMNVNTKNEITDGDVEGKIFGELIKVDLVMNMYKNGKIKSIEGTEQLISQMVSAVGDVDVFTKEVMKESMKGEFSNESLSKSFEQMTYIYPKQPVSVGDTWENKFEGELSSKNVWTLDGIVNDDITITGKSTVVFTTIDPDIEMHLNGDMTSNLTTSKETGFVKTMTTTSTVKGNSIMSNMNTIEVPTTIVSNVTYKIKKHVQ